LSSWLDSRATERLALAPRIESLVPTTAVDECSSAGVTCDGQVILVPTRRRTGEAPIGPGRRAAEVAVTHPPSLAGSSRSASSPKPARTTGTIAEEHRMLSSLLGEIESALKGRTPRRNSGLDVVAVRLDTLRGPLGAHFDEEERAGLFEKIEERVPDQAPACARLKSEHQGLLGRLDELRAVPPEGRRGAEWTRGVKRFLEQLAEHEERETELLTGSLDEPGGAPD
jgi:hypothetical protein